MEFGVSKNQFSFGIDGTILSINHPRIIYHHAIFHLCPIQTFWVSTWGRYGKYHDELRPIQIFFYFDNHPILGLVILGAPNIGIARWLNTDIGMVSPSAMGM